MSACKKQLQPVDIAREGNNKLLKIHNKNASPAKGVPNKIWIFSHFSN